MEAKNKPKIDPKTSVSKARGGASAPWPPLKHAEHVADVTDHLVHLTSKFFTLRFVLWITAGPVHLGLCGEGNAFVMFELMRSQRMLKLARCHH